MILEKDLGLCMGCMSKLEEGQTECPRCGYRDDTPHSLEYLPPKTVLKERYIAGRVLSKNAEGATYIGYDSLENHKVQIREFMPEGVAARNESDQSVYPRPGSEAEYKALMEDFAELSASLYKLGPTKGIVPVVDIFEERGTLYTVYRYIRTLKLGEFLHRSGGELSWSQAKKIFMPLFNTMAGMHKHGVLHRGISPDTLCIDQDGVLWLTDFCIAAVRTDFGELDAELFPGYSAPEQYSQSSWQGSWTDIYSAAAVLYRVLTGTQPTEAVNRKINDSLCPANELNRSIPENVSDAIYAAMLVSTDNRVQSVDDFTGMLLEAASSHTAVFDSSQVSISVKQKKGRGRKSGKKIPYMLFAMLITFLLLIPAVILVAMPYIRGESEPGSRPSQSIFYPEESSGAAAENGVPNFINQYIENVKNNQSYTDKYEFIIKEEYNEDYPANVVYDQAPSAGTPMLNKGKVILYVSKGSELLVMPKLAGSTLDFAIQTLTDMGISFEIMEVENADMEVGLVSRTNFTEGSSINKNKDTVILVTRKADPSEEEDSSSEEESGSGSEEEEWWN